MTRIALLPLLAVLVLPSFAAAAPAGCTPPPGFHDSPHPTIESPDRFVSRTEEILIDRPLDVVIEAMNKPLSDAIQKSSSLPGVAGEYLLTKGDFGAPGSRRIVCLSDGTTVEEQALEHEQTTNFARFRYTVWNYGTPKARGVAYAVGEFRSRQLNPSQTQIVWTYSFRLKDNVFPGSFGALGRFLFRIGFLDREYAEMMRGVLAGYKSDAEARAPASPTAKTNSH